MLSHEAQCDGIVAVLYIQTDPLLVTMLYFVMPNFVLGRLPCCVTSLLLHNIKHRPTA